MKIHLTTSIGEGPTKLAAFDSALYNAGVANYNLLRLSSVIPPGAVVKVHDSSIPEQAVPGGWGDRLYVVMAERREEAHNVEAWAGIGWMQDQETGRGLFVEHDGNSEKTVRNDIEQSLGALATTRGMHFDSMNMKVIGEMCTDRPICALAVAVYQASDWENNVSLAK